MSSARNTKRSQTCLAQNTFSVIKANNLQFYILRKYKIISKPTIDSSSYKSNNPMKTVFLFPGQGAQAIGMQGSQQSSIAKEVFEKANNILGYDLHDLCCKGPLEKLNSTKYSQVAIFVVSWISFLELKQAKKVELAQADDIWYAGLSLGEYTALAAAGVLSFEDCLLLVQERARSMQKACENHQGAMMTVLGLEGSVLRELCKSEGSSVVVANYLFPKGQVVSGDVKAVASLEQSCKAAGATMTAMLKVSGAFHSESMNPAKSSLAAVLNKSAFQTPPKSPKLTVFANITGESYVSLSKECVVDTLLQQLSGSVQWESILQQVTTSFQTGDLMFEVGPGKQIGSMVRRMNPSKECMKSFQSVCAGQYASSILEFSSIIPSSRFLDKENSGNKENSFIHAKKRVLPKSFFLAPIQKIDNLTLSEKRIGMDVTNTYRNDNMSVSEIPRSFGTDVTNTFQNETSSPFAAKSTKTLLRRSISFKAISI